MKKIVKSLLIIVILILYFAGCSSKKESAQVLLKQKDTNLILPEDILAKKSQSNVEEQEQSSLQNSDFIGKKFAVITGTMLDAAVNDNLGNNELMYFNTMHDATEAVKNKKVDAMIGDEPTMRKFIAKNPELSLTYLLHG